MAVIGKIIYAKTAYLDELVRFDARITRFTRNEEMVSMEIQPAADADFFDITEDLFLDWAYSALGDETITLRVKTDDDSAGETFEFPITVAPVPDTFATDDDLLDVETELLDLLKDGTSSFLKINLKATKDVIDELSKRGIRSYTGARLVYSDVADIQEVKNWAIYRALSIIFESNILEVNDTNSQKAEFYRDAAMNEAQRSEFRLKGQVGEPVVLKSSMTATLGRG